MIRGCVMLAILLLAASPLRGQTPTGPPSQLRIVRITQKLNKQIPLDITFQDSSGKTVSPRQLLNGKPAILVPVYYGCPRLCSMILTGLLKSMRAMTLTAGRDFNVLTLSFDPRERPELAAAKKRTYIDSYARPEASSGWHFLTGSKRDIELLTHAVGYEFEYDPKTDQYSHASAIMLLTPDGHVSRYFFGIDFAPRDLRLGLVEAGKGKIGTAVDQILLYCFEYDPHTGKYSFAIMNVIRGLGVVTVLALCTFITVALRRDRNRRTSALEPQAGAS